MQVCPTILLYPCLHRNDSWWIPGNEGPIVVPAASSPQLDSASFLQKCLCESDFPTVNALNDLWYEKHTSVDCLN